MRRRFWYALASGAVVVAAMCSRDLVQAAKDLTLGWRTGIDRDSRIKIQMRDGARLGATLYLPKSLEKPLPAILIRTTYGGMDFATIQSFVSHGYAVLLEDVRGRYRSEGEYRSPYHRTKEDGYDTIDWIVRQPWSNQRVGTFGCSYLGESQIMLASARHPNHVAMIASGSGGAVGKARKSYGYFGVFENGVLNQASALGWFTAQGRPDQRIPRRPADYPERMRQYMSALPVADLGRLLVGVKTGFDDFTRHPLTDAWWDEQGYIGPQDRFSAATLHVNSWYDQTVQGTFDLADTMRENAEGTDALSQHVLIDPGLHCQMDDNPSGRLTVGEMAFEYQALDFRQIYLDWFDHWLKQEAKPLPPNYQFFLIHGNQWRTSETWPPPGTQRHGLYLGSGTLQARPDQASSTQEYDYDPRNPVPTRGGAICCTFDENQSAGAVDQSALAGRPDILTYASAPVGRNLDIIGNPSVDLYVSTDGSDTDFTVKLLDIDPAGKAFNIQDGVSRLRYRNGVDHPELAQPGEIYKISVNLRPVAFRVQQGHRVGLHVSSSNFPRLARDLNTGEDEYGDARTRVAHNRVFVGHDHPSVVWIPTTAAEALTPLHDPPRHESPSGSR
jgi:putative CocE/NonD family hydrolase